LLAKYRKFAVFCYNTIAAKIFRRESEGAAEGGCGGNSAAPERRSPAAPPEYLEGGTEQKNILFLERKNRSRAKSEMRRIFFCEVAERSEAMAGRFSPVSARKRFAQRI